MEQAEVIAALKREQDDNLSLWGSLTDEDWRRPSLCRGWTVKDVAEHVIAGERTEFQPSIRRALEDDPRPPVGFQLEMANAENVRRGRDRSVAELLDEASQVATDSIRMLKKLGKRAWVKPAWAPLAPQTTVSFYARGRIWEWWTHGQDVRVPLNRPGGLEPERTTPVVEVVRDGIENTFRPERARGVRTSYAFDIGGTHFTIRIDDGTMRVEDGFDPKARVRIHADPATFLLVGLRRMSQTRAVLSRKFRPSGNLLEGLKFLRYFGEA